MPQPKTQRIASVLTNVKWIFLEQVLRIALVFLVSIVVINYLGAERFGLYSYVISIVSIVLPLTSFGLEQVVISKLVERPQDHDRVLGTALAIRLAGGLIGYAICLGTVLTLDRGDALRMRLAAVAGVVLPLQIFDTATYYFRSIMGAKYIVLSRLAGLLTMTLLTVLLLLRHAGLEALLWPRNAEAVVVGVALIIAYDRRGETMLNWRFDHRELMGLLRAGWPLFISSLFVMVYVRSDQLLLEHMSGDSELGYYNAAVRMAEVINFVPMAIVGAIYPALVSYRQSGEKLFAERVQELYHLMTLIGYAFAAAAMLAAPLAFRLLFQHRYDPALPMFLVLVWSSVFVCVGVAVGAVSTAVGRFSASVTSTLLGMLANISLNMLLIPHFGGLGSAWATLIAYWIASHISYALIPGLRSNFVMITRALMLPDVRVLWRQLSRLRPVRPPKS